MIQNAEFAFDIKDTVYLRTQRHDVDRIPARFIVIEQIGRWCEGGFQAFYCIGASDGTHKELSQVALTAECPPYEPVSDAALADHLHVLRVNRNAAGELDRANMVANEVMLAERREARVAERVAERAADAAAERAAKIAKG